MKTPDEVLATIHSYLGNGGLFNPEMMEHDRVRELILDCRGVITAMEPDTKHMDFLDSESLHAEFYLDMMGEPDVRAHIDKAMARHKKPNPGESKG